MELRSVMMAKTRRLTDWWCTTCQRQLAALERPDSYKLLDAMSCIEGWLGLEDEMGKLPPARMEPAEILRMRDRG